MSVANFIIEFTDHKIGASAFVGCLTNFPDYVNDGVDFCGTEFESEAVRMGWSTARIMCEILNQQYNELEFKIRLLSKKYMMKK